MGGIHHVSACSCYVIWSNRRRINRVEGVSLFSNKVNSVSSSDVDLTDPASALHLSDTNCYPQ